MSAGTCATGLSRLAERLSEVRGVEIRLNEPLAKYTSFGVGGPADILAVPEDARALSEVMRIAGEAGLEPLLLGKGTNLIVRDGGVRGVVVLTTKGLNQWQLRGTEAIVEAGTTLGALCRMCADHGLEGMEFAAGIPGTLGGALIMNAGANGGEIGGITQWVDVVGRDGVLRRYAGSELQFGYRHSALREMGGAIVRASLQLRQGDPKAVHSALCDRMMTRYAKQPVSMASAGSIFKRPEGDYAGRLLEEAGAKGMKVGGAQVSTKHANFVVNLGGATARDVLELIAAARQLVYENSGVLLEPEVCVVGEDPE